MHNFIHTKSRLNPSFCMLNVILWYRLYERGLFMKQNKPKIPKALSDTADFVPIVLTAQEEETDIEGKIIHDFVLEDHDFLKASFHECVFENCRFTDSNFSKSEFVDVVFRFCDFSGCDFSKSYFNRCEFHSCKGTGGHFQHFFVRDVLFSDCNFQYANFTFSKWQNVLVCQTTFSESSLEECKLKNLVLDNADLKRVGFFNTPLKDIDFTTSDISGISASPYELNGAKVNTVQAAELAKLLGVIVL